MLPIVDAVSDQVTTFGELNDGLAGICCNSARHRSCYVMGQLPEGAAHSQEKVLAPPRRPLEEAKSRPSGPQVVAEIIPDDLFLKSHS